jgi:hypothetical protein
MTTRYGEKRYTLTNAYVWFLIPLWIELQHVERLEVPESPPGPAP